MNWITETFISKKSGVRTHELGRVEKSETKVYCSGQVRAKLIAAKLEFTLTFRDCFIFLIRFKLAKWCLL